MKTEFNIINLRKTIMVYPFSFSFFLSLHLLFLVFVFRGFIGGVLPLIAVCRIDAHAASQHQMTMKI